MSIDQINKFKPAIFDTVILLGHNFGLFGDFKKAKMLLRKLYRITAPGVLIIAETLDPYKTNNPAHLGYHKLNRKRGRMSGQMKIRLRFSQYIGEWFDYLFVSKQEMQEILKDSGWKIKKFIDYNNPTYTAIIEKEI